MARESEQSDDQESVPHHDDRHRQWFDLRRITGSPLFWIAMILLLPFLVYYGECADGMISKCNYHRIQDGMSLQEVQHILGPGFEVAPGMVPAPPSGPPFVRGTQFYLFRNGPQRDVLVDEGIYIGLHDEKVVGKYWHSVSL